MRTFLKTTTCCFTLIILTCLCCVSTYADTFPFSVSANNLRGIAVDLTRETSKQALTQLGVAPIPEPSTMILFGTGVASRAGALRKRRRSR